MRVAETRDRYADTGPGWRGLDGRVGSTWPQLGAEAVQITLDGRAISGSSRAPARTTM